MIRSLDYAEKTLFVTNPAIDKSQVLKAIIFFGRTFYLNFMLISSKMKYNFGRNRLFSSNI